MHKSYLHNGCPAHFYTSVYFKTSETKNTIDPDKISEKNISKLINKLLENLSEFYVTSCRIETLFRSAYVTFAAKALGTRLFLRQLWAKVNGGSIFSSTKLNTQRCVFKDF